jgi:SAM-dependent methyltransferase
MPNLQSVLRAQVSENLFHVTVINNGHPDSCDWIGEHPRITVLQPGENLGWEGGLKLGLEKTSAPFVVFYNDDTHVPVSSRLWLHQLIQHFKDPTVGAVGPSSNVVMGLQNIFIDLPAHQFPTKFLIFFCAMLRRSAIEEAGGIDTSLPGGDDLDLSIRLRDKGYKLIVDRDVFIFHHGFKTGTRLHGDANTPGGWNSIEMTERTDHALIRKHGFRKWYEMKMGVFLPPTVEYKSSDTEGDLIRKRIQGDVILDLGCGPRKTVLGAIGIDMVKMDEVIETLGQGVKSQADVVANVAEPLPFEKDSADTIIARHILEHMTDPISTIRNWKQVLKRGGKLIIAVPNQSVHVTIPMNIEHVHAYTPQSLRVLLESLGFAVKEQLDGQNAVSFITVAEKL